MHVWLAGNLGTLILAECTALTALPDVFDRLFALDWLDVFGCDHLTALPTSVGSLAHVLELDLSGCSSLSSLPRSLGGMDHLLRCDLGWCMASLPTQHQTQVHIRVKPAHWNAIRAVWAVFEYLAVCLAALICTPGCVGHLCT